jgi:D-alanyl-D-alanine carboxypeptidase
MTFRRRLAAAFVGAVLLVSGLASAPGAAGAAELRIAFAAGCHTGHRFDPSGAITATLTACLSRPSGAPANARSWISGRGVHFAISAGIWAGYAIPETPRSHLPGYLLVQEFPVPERRVFPTGVYIGYTFDEAWTTPAVTRSAWINRASGASVVRHAVINGQYHYLVADGMFAGLWVRAQGYSRSSFQMHYGPHPPSCRVADVLTARRTYEHWGTSLLDTEYMLTSGYAPADRVSTSTVGLNGGHTVRGHVAPDLRAMAAAARAAGRPIQIVSAYRSYATQVAVFNDNVARYGYAYALRRSARPGHSEHQLGTTLDVTHAGGLIPWSYTDWATHPTGAWMRDNAWRYGFVMSYPKGSEAKTCYDYEPWHYRYVGRTMAAQVRESGLTLREWIWRRYGR